MSNRVRVLLSLLFIGLAVGLAALLSVGVLAIPGGWVAIVGFVLVLASLPTFPAQYEDPNRFWQRMRLALGLVLLIAGAAAAVASFGGALFVPAIFLAVAGFMHSGWGLLSYQAALSSRDRQAFRSLLVAVVFAVICVALAFIPMSSPVAIPVIAGFLSGFSLLGGGIFTMSATLPGFSDYAKNNLHKALIGLGLLTLVGGVVALSIGTFGIVPASISVGMGSVYLLSSLAISVNSYFKHRSELQAGMHVPPCPTAAAGSNKSLSNKILKEESASSCLKDVDGKPILHRSDSLRSQLDSPSAPCTAAAELSATRSQRDKL